MKLQQLLGMALLGAGLLATGCSSLSTSSGPNSGLRATNVELYIVSQSCFQGEVVPCGWHGKKGGLARRAAFIDSARVQGRPLLVLDGGDFFHRSGADNYAESVLTWTEMERRGYDAVTLGELELTQWDVIDSLMQVSSLPVVCTNVECLRDGGRWEQVGKRYHIVEVNGLKVGIVSAIGPNQFTAGVIQKSGDRLRMLPPAETAQAAIDEIKDRTDAIVLLAHLDPRPMEQFGSTLQDVDVILGGHMTQLDPGPVPCANAVINRSSTRGQHLSVTRLIVSPEGEVVDIGGVNVTLEATYPEDPAVAELAASAKEEGQRRVRERSERQREALQKRANPPSGDGKGGGVEE